MNKDSNILNPNGGEEQALVERLREFGSYCPDESARGRIGTYVALCSSAADRIEALESQLSRLSEVEEAFSRATPIRREIERQEKDGQERFVIKGVPCGFPIATFGDHCDAELFVAVHEALLRSGGLR